jgi:hypothetical protein
VGIPYCNTVPINVKKLEEYKPYKRELKCRVFSFGYHPGVRIKWVDVSEPGISSIFLDQFLFKYIKTNTRQTSNLYLPSSNLAMYQKGIYYSGIKIYNHLLTAIKDLSGDKNTFKLTLKSLVNERTWCTIYSQHLLSNLFITSSCFGLLQFHHQKEQLYLCDILYSISWNKWIV